MDRLWPGGPPCEGSSPRGPHYRRLCRSMTAHPLEICPRLQLVEDLIKLKRKSELEKGGGVWLSDIFTHQSLPVLPIYMTFTIGATLKRL